MAAKRRKYEPHLKVADCTPQQLGAIHALFHLGDLSPIRSSVQTKMMRAWEKSKSDDFLILSSRQIGKTDFGLQVAIETCIMNGNARVIYFGPTLKSLYKIVQEGIRRIKEFAPEGLIQATKSDMIWKIGTSELRLFPLERAHIDSARGSNSNCLIVVEEACFVSSDDWDYAYSSIIKPMRTNDKVKLLINTTPSVDVTHSIHVNLLPRLQLKNATARFTIYDNLNLTDKKIEELKEDITEEAWRREFLAEIFRSEESTILPEFDIEKVRAKLQAPKFANWIISADLSHGSIDPTAILLCYQDYDINKFCIYREAILPAIASLPEIKLAIDNLISHKTHGQISYISDAPELIRRELSRLGVMFQEPPSKGPGSFQANIEAFRVALKNNEILVDQSCEEALYQMNSGQYDKHRKDFKRSNGNHLDALAAMFYAFKHRSKYNPYPEPVSTSEVFVNPYYEHDNMEKALRDAFSWGFE